MDPESSINICKLERQSMEEQRKSDAQVWELLETLSETMIPGGVSVTHIPALPTGLPVPPTLLCVGSFNRICQSKTSITRKEIVASVSWTKTRTCIVKRSGMTI